MQCTCRCVALARSHANPVRSPTCPAGPRLLPARRVSAATATGRQSRPSAFWGRIGYIRVADPAVAPPRWQRSGSRGADSRSSPSSVPFLPRSARDRARRLLLICFAVRVADRRWADKPLILLATLRIFQPHEQNLQWLSRSNHVDSTYNGKKKNRINFERSVVDS